MTEQNMQSDTPAPAQHMSDFVAALRGALEPFARASSDFDTYHAGYIVDHGKSLTVGDLRLAKAAFDTPAPQDQPIGFMDVDALGTLVDEVRARPASSPAPQDHVEGKEPPLDWSNFEGPKRNIDWKPGDQDLIYTAINYRDDEYGDADEDVGQQLVERLLAAWKTFAISEQITFENAARLLKERDAAEKARAEQWRLRRDAEASRDAMRAAADSLLQDRKALIEAIQPLMGCADFARQNDLSGHETVIVTASEAREAATIVERITAEEEDQS